jgi:S-phase kinase-associated protein 1
MITITSTTDDNARFVVPVERAKRIAVIASFIEGECEAKGIPVTKDIVMPLSVDASTLDKVLQWCSLPKDTTWPVAQVAEWPQEVHFAIILAANYLDLKDLLEFMGKYIASTIKGKTPEELRKMFGIVNDFTPEEEARVRAENEWCEEQ